MRLIACLFTLTFLAFIIMPGVSCKKDPPPEEKKEDSPKDSKEKVDTKKTSEKKSSETKPQILGKKTAINTKISKDNLNIKRGTLTNKIWG